jgi:hypothetical protein
VAVLALVLVNVFVAAVEVLKVVQLDTNVLHMLLIAIQPMVKYVEVQLAVLIQNQKVIQLVLAKNL